MLSLSISVCCDCGFERCGVRRRRIKSEPKLDSPNIMRAMSLTMGVGVCLNT